MPLVLLYFLFLFIFLIKQIQKINKYNFRRKKIKITKIEYLFYQIAEEQMIKYLEFFGSSLEISLPDF